MTALGLGVAPGRALEEGVGQVVEGDGLREREQIALLLVEKGFQGRAVRQQPVARPVEVIQVQGGEVVVEQLPQGAALLQPLVGRPFAAGTHHAPDNDPDGSAHLVAIEPQLRQLEVQPQPS